MDGPLVTSNLTCTRTLTPSFIQGWQYAQMGPSFLDLQFITGVSLEKGSAFVTAFFVGYVVGALVGGFMFDRYNKLLIIFFNLLLNATCIIITPWCSVYGVMVAIQFSRGVCSSGLNTCKYFKFYKVFRKSTPLISRTIYLRCADISRHFTL